MLETKTKNMSIPVYDLMAARAKRKVERKAKRAANKAEGKARRQHRKDLIASMPGTSSLEKRLNYAAYRHNVKKADRKTQKAAIEKARSVTPEQRKANQNKATADHNKRLADAIAKHGGKKKTNTNTNTSGISNTRKEFNKAFAAASKAGKKTFMFRNKKYTTEKA